MRKSRVAVVVATVLALSACGSSDDPVDTTDPAASPSDDAAVGEAMTIEEALSADVSGRVAVSGYLFDDGTGLRLCSVLAESFPPQCGELSLPVEGLDLDRINDVPNYELVQVENSGGVSWTDAEVTLSGEVANGNLVVE